jgi:hypothetical protein
MQVVKQEHYTEQQQPSYE